MKNTKIRSWNKFENQFFYFQNGRYYKDSDCAKCVSDRICGEFIWSNAEWCTQLKDKNGVDIYEGDILQYHYLKNYIQQSHYGVRPEIDEMIIAKASDTVVYKNGCFLMFKEAHTDDFPYLTPLSEYGLFSIERVKEDIFGELLEELSEEEQSGDCDGTDINESILGIEVIGNIHSNPELIK